MKRTILTKNSIFHNLKYKIKTIFYLLGILILVIFAFVLFFLIVRAIEFEDIIIFIISVFLPASLVILFIIMISFIIFIFQRIITVSSISFDKNNIYIGKLIVPFNEIISVNYRYYFDKYGRKQIKNGILIKYNKDNKINKKILYLEYYSNNYILLNELIPFFEKDNY